MVNQDLTGFRIKRQTYPVFNVVVNLLSKVFLLAAHIPERCWVLHKHWRPTKTTACQYSWAYQILSLPLYHFSSSSYQTWHRCSILSFLFHTRKYMYFLFLFCSDESHNHSSGPISRTDEQSLLSRILHQTAQYVIIHLSLYKNNLPDKNKWLKYILYIYMNACIEI